MTALAVQPAPLAYGLHTADMVAGTKTRAEARDRAAFVFVTGHFPSHLRANYMGILHAITASFAKPVALDGRSGSMRVADVAVIDLDLENHPLVTGVRSKVADGFLIQPSRGLQARRPFGKVFMYRPSTNGNELIVVNSDGSIKNSWD